LIGSDSLFQSFTMSLTSCSDLCILAILSEDLGLDIETLTSQRQAAIGDFGWLTILATSR
jgi:hypothetical protein